MKKIMIDLTPLADNFSGVERFALSVTKELYKRSDVELILIFKDSVFKDFAELKNGVEKIVLTGGNKLIFNQVVLPLKLRHIEADYYMFLAFPAPFLWFKKNTISTIHDVSVWDCPETNKRHMVAYFRLLFRKVAWGRGKVLTVSEFSKRRINEILHIPNDKIKVVYSGLSDTFLDFDENIERNYYVKEKYELPSQYLLCLSTLEPRKNLKLLLDAYADLVREGDFDFDLVLAGRKGWMVDDLMENMSANISAKIHFTGFVEEQDLPYIYRGAELFVFPSIYEGFGVPPLEALSMGTLVISSDAASLPEIAGDMAIYFHNNDKEDLKKKIKGALSMDKEERRNAVNQKQEGLHKYTWDQVTDKIYEFVIKEK